MYCSNWPYPCFQTETCPTCSERLCTYLCNNHSCSRVKVMDAEKMRLHSISTCTCRCCNRCQVMGNVHLQSTDKFPCSWRQAQVEPAWPVSMHWCGGEKMLCLVTQQQQQLQRQKTSSISSQSDITLLDTRLLQQNQQTTYCQQDFSKSRLPHKLVSATSH